jgi:hypothetical protein
MMLMHVFGPNAQSDISRSLEKALKLVKDFLSCAGGFFQPFGFGGASVTDFISSVCG